jgi:hypothetical protein
LTDHVYHDATLTITRDFIRLPTGEREVIPIDSIQSIVVTRRKVGDHTTAGIVFLLLGILSIWFVIGFLFIAWGIAGLLTKIYSYHLILTVGGEDVEIRSGKRKGPLKSLARTIHGLVTSRQT